MSECVICNGKLVEDMRIKGLDTFVAIEGTVVEYSVGWYCEECGIKYRMLPTERYREKEREFLEGVNYPPLKGRASSVNWLTFL